MDETNVDRDANAGEDVGGDLLSAWEDLTARLRVLTGAAPPEADPVAETLSDKSLSWPPIGWTPGLESRAWRTLHEATRDIAPMGHPLEEVFDDGPWTRLFFVSQEVITARVNADLRVALWSTKPLRRHNWSSSADNHLLQSLRILALRFHEAVAEHHLPAVKYHLHLVDRDARRLDYRLLFDKRRSSDELAWEPHGGERGYRPYGEPKDDVLSDRVSREVHVACLKACALIGNLGGSPKNRNKHKDKQYTDWLRGTEYRKWAEQFAPTGDDSYIAYPPPQGGVPVKWRTRT